MAATEPPLVVIVGPTASGKSDLALQAAKKYSGEIVCADSRTIYRDTTIGTAKPSAQDQAEVPHWGLDLVDPNEAFTAAEFQTYAQQKIREIRARGQTPFLVGGTGLYIDSVVFNYQFGDKSRPALRRQLEGYSLEALAEYCYKNNIKLPKTLTSRRHIIRAIEQGGVNTLRQSVIEENTVVVGITAPKHELHGRMAARAHQMIEQGVVSEATKIAQAYGWEAEALSGNVYPIIHSFHKDELTETEMMEQFIYADRRLAKRQMTWFRRNPYIIWTTREKGEAVLDERIAALTTGV